ncbi:thymidylate kinase isoform X1 [Geospiza fortis]|uniref:dTMP kinase n=1 Tax=Geospiza fortis TaxID=48883 RepID=A0A8N5EXE5_GEOFO|nr:thymidylate kinase isoform X1 [Geospiza fortis]
MDRQTDLSPSMTDTQTLPCSDQPPTHDRQTPGQTDTPLRRALRGSLGMLCVSCRQNDRDWAADQLNRWEHVPMMKEKLQQGITVVVDRYAFSGVAFTSAKGNFGLDWCKQPDVGLPKPDLILFLQLNPEAAAERGNFGQERYETSSFQEKVLQCFYCLMEDKTLNWKTVDASKSIEDLHREIKSIAKETMQEVQNKPLGELWK